MVSRRKILVACFSLLVFPVLFGGSAFGGDIFAYKPHSKALKYTLNIKNHAEVDTGWARIQGTIFRDHEDNITFSQKVSDDGDGLLDIAATVDKINFLPHGPTYGAAYKREEIEGNTQRIKIDVLGRVKEAKFLPHIGSSQFWRKGHDGPPLDYYNIMLMLNPRFPLGLLDVGSAWEVEDEIDLGLADIPPVAGLQEIHYELEMTVKQKIKYKILGFVKKNGYRCARIGFEAESRVDGVMRDAHTGSYLDSNGKSSGELLFAPKEGVLVAASMKHNIIERTSRDGQVIHMITPKERIFMYSYDHTTIPLSWRAERTVSLELAKGMDM